MGIKTALTLDEANRLFDTYRFTAIRPTTEGIIDTTYIVDDNATSYILKRFEEADAAQIALERALLARFEACDITVPQHLCSAADWHLYTRLPGRSPKSASLRQLQSLARVLAKMHRCSQGLSAPQQLIDATKISASLNRLKQNRYSHYTALRHLRFYSPQNDGLIHGDLFLDNALFNAHHVGIIDFIDAGEGSFAFDLGVTALTWAYRGSTTGRLRLFLQAYNQQAPRKIGLPTLLESLKEGAAFYTLSRMVKQSGSPAHRQALLKRSKIIQRGQPC